MAIPALLLIAGCSHSWAPSDAEAVQMVKNYFLFSYEGKEITAHVLERKDFNKGCKCYPITFKIRYSPQRDNHKTFYFYKDSNGNTALREYFSFSTL